MASREGFDRYLSVFSPDGHLFQVEYAFKAVSACGLTAIGVRAGNTVVLATQKKLKDRLIDPSSVTNMYRLTSRIGCVMVGSSPDCQAVVNRAREEASTFEFENGYSIPTGYLAKRMADIAQSGTQHAGLRPLAVVIILAGVDEELGPQLFRVDLAGTVFGYTACAAGTKEQEAVSLLEKRIKERTSSEPLSTDAAAQMALEVLQTCVGADFKANEVEVGLALERTDLNSQGFAVMKDDEVDRILGAIAERD